MICHQPVCCWPLPQTPHACFSCPWQWDGGRDGRCWQCDAWLPCQKTRWSMSRRGARRLRMALTIFPSLMGQEGSIRASQNICMWMLPLSISIRPSSDRAVYDLRNIRAISPSHEKRGFLPRLLLWLRLVHATANSLSGSWEWIRLSSFFAKLSR